MTFPEDEIAIIKKIAIKNGMFEVKPGIFQSGEQPHEKRIDTTQESITFPGMPPIGLKSGIEIIEKNTGVGAIEALQNDIHAQLQAHRKKKTSSAYPKKEKSLKEEIKAPEKPKLEAEMKDIVHHCRDCGYEINGQQAMHCFEIGIPKLCENCESKLNEPKQEYKEAKKEQNKMNEQPKPVKPTESNQNLPVPAHSNAIVRPAVSVQEAISAWKEFNDLKAAIITQDDRQKIGDKFFVKKSGWRKLAAFFNLTDKIIEEIQIPHIDGGGWTWKIKVVVTAPNGRASEGVGICSTSERKFAHVEHDTYATAHTRAKNRAISDMIAGGEVSFEEVE